MTQTNPALPLQSGFVCVTPAKTRKAQQTLKAQLDQPAVMLTYAGVINIKLASDVLLARLSYRVSAPDCSACGHGLLASK